MKFAAAVLVGTISAVQLNQLSTREGDHKPPSAQEIADLIMEHFDHNEDGKISHKEFVATLKALAKEHDYKPSKEDWEEANAAFDEADTNNDDHVDRKELIAAVKKHMNLSADGPSAEEIADYIMSHFDHNEDGQISVKEFRKTLKALAEEHDYKPTKEDWKEAMAMFREADTDNNKHVSRDELVAAVKKHMNLSADGPSA
jgi:Ca2+-binding EF-hand superfamily protein